MTPQPFSEEMVGGRQLRLFDEDTESGLAIGGPGLGPTRRSSPDNDTARTESQP